MVLSREMQCIVEREIRLLFQTWNAIFPNIGLHFFPRPNRQVPFAMLLCDGPTDHQQGLWVVEQFNNHIRAGRLMEADELIIYYVEEISTTSHVGFVSKQDFLLIRGTNPLAVEYTAINCWHQLCDD